MTEEVEQTVVASIVGRTVRAAALVYETRDEWTGCSVLVLKLDDDRTITVRSHGWHDISSLSIEQTNG